MSVESVICSFVTTAQTLAFSISISTVPLMFFLLIEYHTEVRVSIKLFYHLAFISSPEPKALRRAYSIPMLRRPSSLLSSVHNVQTSSPPIKAKFYVEPPWEWELKFV